MGLAKAILYAMRQFFSPLDGDARPAAFRRDGLTARIAPFALPVALGFFVALGPNPYPQPERAAAILHMVAAVLSVALLVLIYLLPWERMPRSAEAIPPLGLVIIIFMVRAGNPAQEQVFAPLVLLPLFWLSLYGTRFQLLSALMLVTMVELFSSVAQEGTVDILRFQLLALLISPIVCFTTQSLVQRVRMQAQLLRALVTTDALTEIPNRRAWDDELPRALSRASRGFSPICVALLDLDNFKRYNDTKGHQAGDALLRDVARLWTQALRSCDFLARYGGEEFAVILPSCDAKEAKTVLNRLCKATPDNQTCSVGVSVWDGRETEWSLLERTDAALYQAKENGRNRIEESPGPLLSSEDSGQPFSAASRAVTTKETADNSMSVV